MNVLTHISLNFQQPNYLTVYAAQNDRLSRYINAQLLDGSAPWTLPTGGLMTIRYRKPDGTSGFYDTLEDGSPAYNVETDGSITFGLAEQTLTVPGAVPVELNFYNAAGSKLSTLTFIVAVKPSAYSDEDIASSDYYNILTAKMQQLAELSDQAEGDYQDYLSALSAFVGAPRTAPTAADMLDTNLVYVYTGSETGWIYGDWYYYNGREWTSGGVYNSAAISLDDTLTNANKPAQAKAAGDLVLVQDTQPTAPVNKLWFPLTDPEDEQVPTWDEFSDLKSSLSIKVPDIEIGSIDGTTGQDATGPRRARTVGYISIKDFWYCDPRGTDYSIIVFLYDANKSYIKRLTNGFLGNRVADYEILKDYSTAEYVRVAFGKSGSANMTDADLVAIRELIRIYRSEDGTIIHGDDLMTTNINDSIARIDSDWFGTGYIGVEVGTLNFETGEDSDNTKRCRTKGYIPINDFVACSLIGTDYLAMYFLYDADKTFLLCMPFDYDVMDLTRFGIIRNYPNAKFVRFAIKRTDAATMTDADIALLRTRISVRNGLRRVDVDKAKFDGQFNYVAYSKLSSNDAPINSEEHFINCANTGKFTALKGDVRNTADGGLIMCHDAGYTFDSNGKITSYDNDNSTPIDTLTVAECKALTFAAQWDGKDVHPCDFETFVRVCKKHGLICYVTVRDEHIADVVAPEVLRILTLYRMIDHAIINSFTGATLEIFRSLHPSITLSQVMNHWYIPTHDDVDYVYSLGNCIINLFNVPVQDSVPGTNVEDKLEYLLSTSEYVDMLDYAHSKNVVLYDAQTGNAAPDVLLRHGIVGAHMTVIPDYDWKRS